MDVPPKAFYPRRFKASPATSMAKESVAAAASQDFRDKLATLVDRNNKVKMAYNQLQSQIAFGLVEAGEVFESLAIPLMKLVGLKTSEMESEGRQSTFIINTKRYHMDTTQNGARPGDLNNEICSSKEESYAAKAESARLEILHKHKGQLRQLVHMLKHTETQVNTHREDILQIVDDRRNFFQEFIQKSLYYLSQVHRQNHDTFPVTVKLLRVLFNNIGEVLGSVDNGVNDLMQTLGKNMCQPMTNYVGNLAAEIKLGPCVKLMDVVKEMERANLDTRRELQYAREMVRRAEETKMDALLKLKKAEDHVQRMTTSAKKFLPASQNKNQAEHSITGKRIRTEESGEHEEKLLWELLSRKRKQKEPERPVVPKELKRLADGNLKSLVTRGRTRSQTARSIPLGVSPSTRTVTWR